VDLTELPLLTISQHHQKLINFHSQRRCCLLELFAPVAEAVTLADRLPGRLHAIMGADDICLGLVVKAEQVIADGNFSRFPPSAE
jgi:hypothetical protein